MKEEYYKKIGKSSDKHNKIEVKQRPRAVTNQEKLERIYEYHDIYVINNEERVIKALSNPETMQFYFRVKGLSLEVKYDMIEKRVKIVNNKTIYKDIIIERAMDELIALLVFLKIKELERPLDDEINIDDRPSNSYKQKNIVEEYEEAQDYYDDGPTMSI